MLLALDWNVHEAKLVGPVFLLVRMQANEVFCLREAVDGQTRLQSLDVGYRGLLLGLELVQIESSFGLFDRSCCLFSLLFGNDFEIGLLRLFVCHVGLLGLAFGGADHDVTLPTRRVMTSRSDCSAAFSTAN